MVKQNLRILFYLSKKRIDKNGYCPIFARITIDGVREEFSTKCKLLPNQWDGNKKKCTGNSTMAYTTNNKLSQLKSDIEKTFLLLGLKNVKILPQMVIATLFPKEIVEKKKENENLSKEVEALYLEIVDYYKEEKKCDRIKNGQIHNRRLLDLSKSKGEIRRKIETLIRQTNIERTGGTLKNTLMNAVYDFILNFSRQVIGGKRKFSTLRKWHYTKEKIKGFCWYHYQKTVFSLTEIQFSFAQNFYDYLTLVDNCGHNLAMKYIKNTKQIFERAEDQGWLDKNPIASFRCNYIEPEKDPVVMDDIIKLINANLDGSLDKVRDAFLFSIFTGFAYEDTRRLEPKDIFTGIDGKLWIGTDRIKTGNGEKVPLLPLPLQIIKKYETHPCRIFDDKLIPIYSNQTYNKKLKIIASECDIKIDLTTHIARHTFATVITLENDVPIATVRSLMGQKTLRTTEKYAKATRKKVSRNMSILESKLFDENGVLIGLGKEGDCMI